MNACTNFTIQHPMPLMFLLFRDKVPSEKNEDTTGKQVDKVCIVVVLHPSVIIDRLVETRFLNV
jgi:hypothetical protein